MEAITGLGAIFVSGISLAAVILGFFIPFFVYRIRNETIKTNRKLDQLIDLMAQKNELLEQSHPQPGKNKCPKCGKDVMEGEAVCFECGELL